MHPCSVDGWGLGQLLKTKQIKRMIASYVGMLVKVIVGRLHTLLLLLIIIIIIIIINSNNNKYLTTIYVMLRWKCGIWKTISFWRIRSRTNTTGMSLLEKDDIIIYNSMYIYILIQQALYYHVTNPSTITLLTPLHFNSSSFSSYISHPKFLLLQYPRLY